MKKTLLILALATAFVSAQTITDAGLTDADQLNVVDIADDGAVWLGSDDGKLYVSADDGASWTVCPDSGGTLEPTYGGTSIYGIHAVSAEKVYALTANAVFESGTPVDTTFVEVLSESTTYWFNVLLGMDNGDLWALGDDPGDGNFDIRVSTDDGATWNSLATEPAGGGAFGIGLTKSGYRFDDDLIFFGTNSDEYLFTTDGGATWTEYTTPDGNAAWSFAFKDASSGVIGGGDGKVFTTIDGGATLTDATTSPNAGSGEDVFVVHVGASIYLAACGDEIYRSTDDGDNWTSIHTQTDAATYQNIAIADDGSNYVAYAVATGGKYTKIEGELPTEKVLELTFEEGATPIVDYSPEANTVTVNNGPVSYVSDAPASGTYSLQFQDSIALNPSYLTAVNPKFDATGEFSVSCWVKFEEQIIPFTRFVILAQDVDAAGALHYQQAFYIRTNNDKGQLRAQYRGPSADVTIDTRDQAVRVGEWFQVIFELGPEHATLEVRDADGNMVTKAFDNANVAGNPMNDGSLNKLFLGWALNDYEGYNRHFTGEMDDVEYWNGPHFALDTVAPPVITSMPVLSAFEGVPATYAATYTHQNGLSATISFENLPAWLSQSGDTLTGTPPVTGSPSEGEFLVIADDGSLTDTLFVEYSVAIPETLYASPDGSPSGDGTETNPYDFATAESMLESFTTLMLLPGTYEFTDIDTKFLDAGPSVEKVSIIGRDGATETVIDGMNAADEWGYLNDGFLVKGLTFQNFAFREAWSGGNAIFTVIADNNDSASVARVTECVFNDNGAQGFFATESDGYLQLDNCIVSNTGDYYAKQNIGFLMSTYRAVMLFNNTFYNNHPRSDINDLTVIDVWSYNNSDEIVALHAYNNLFVYNTTDELTGIAQVRCDDETHPTDGDHTAIIYRGNNMYFGNYFVANETDTSDDVPNDTLATWEGSDGGPEGVTFDELVGAEKIIGDPMFADAENGDFRLDPSSPAVNAGMEIAAIGTGPNPHIGCLMPGLAPVGVEDDPGAVKEFALRQNYPNPFNPATTIKFQLPRDADVTLAVYDVLGAEVARLVDGEMQAGRHEVSFNAADFASGVYFYRIQAEDFVSVKKMMLLK
jgi:hypothetical protein